MPAASLVSGVALRDCLLLAATGPLALGAFYLGMDAGQPVGAFRSAARCAFAGLASLTGAVFLVLAVLAAIHGLWNPSHDRFLAGAWILAASIGAFLVVSSEEIRVVDRGSLGRAFGIAALLAALAAIPLATGLEWSVCALPVATAVLMAFFGWRLLSEVVPAALALGQRR